MSAAAHSPLVGWSRTVWCCLLILLLGACSDKDGDEPHEDASGYAYGHCEAVAWPPPMTFSLSEWTGEPEYQFEPANWTWQSHPISTRILINSSMFGEGCATGVEAEESLDALFTATGLWSRSYFGFAFVPSIDDTSETPASTVGDVSHNYAWCDSGAMPSRDSVGSAAPPSSAAVTYCELEGDVDPTTSAIFYCGLRRCDITVYSGRASGEDYIYEAYDPHYYPGEISLTTLFAHELGHVLGLGHNPFGVEESLMIGCDPGLPSPYDCTGWTGAPAVPTSLDYEAQRFLYDR